MTTIKKSVLTFACLMAATVANAGGHIYDIRPYYDNEIKTGPMSSPEKPMVGGDTVSFTLRFAPDKENCGKSESDYKWKLHFLAGSTTSETLAWLNNPLKIGIYVSGELREATLVTVAPSITGDDYTDFIFEYVAKPGDFALPIILAVGSKTPEPASGKATDVTYYVKPSSLVDWRIVNNIADATTESGKQEANFWFGSWNNLQKPAGADYPPANDYDLRGAGFYVKTVDFDAKWEREPKTESETDAGLWRSVREGTTETVGTQPTLALVAPATNSVTLHVWSDNSAAVVVQGFSKTSPYYVREPYKVYMNLDKSGTLVATNTVLDVKIPAYTTSIPFDICGVASNETANLILSSNTNYVYNSSGFRDAYVSVPVKCVERPPASVTVALDGDDPLVVNVSSNYQDCVGTMYVKASTGYTNALTVTVTPRLVDTTATDGWSNYVHIADGKAGSKWATTTPCTVTFTAAEIASGKQKPVYIFAMGADAHTSALDKGIAFDVEIDADAKAYYRSYTCDSRVRLVPAKPVIAQPAENEKLEANGNTTREFDIVVNDSYRNVTDRSTGYKVYIRREGKEKTVTELAGAYGADEEGLLWKLGADGSLTSEKPSIVYYASGTYDTQIYVLAPDGKTKSETRTVSMTVSEPASVTPHTNLNSSNTTNEGEMVTVYVTLSEKNSTGKAIYAFLKPVDEDSSNKVSSTCLSSAASSKGLKIGVGKINSALGTLLLLDGQSPKLAGTALEYELVLCYSSSYDETQLVEGFESENLALTVLNVEPTVNEVRMNGVDSVTEDGGIMPGTVSKEVERTFTFDIEEPGINDLTATGDEAFQLKYSIKEAGGGSYAPDPILGNPNTNSFKYAFKSTGRATVTVELMDKDMKAYPGKFGGKFTFYVDVTDQPAVSIKSDSGNFDFEEDKTGLRYTKMTLKLSKNPSSDNLEFAIAVTPKFTDASNPGTLVLGGATPTKTNANVYVVQFLPAQTEATFYIEEADGTKLTESKGYALQARCITETLSPDGKPWNEVFVSDPAVYLTLANVRPSITTDLGEENTETNAFIAAIGDYDYPVGYTVSDIDFDLGEEGSTTNLTVTWYSEGTGSVTTNVSDSSKTYVFTPNFKSSGNGKVVYVTVTDKDGGKIQKKWYFDVQTSKTLVAYPVGPSAGTTSLADRYQSLLGCGEGHVYVSSATAAGTDFFRQNWNCSLANDAEAYAWGYKVGAVDDGTLDGGYDVAIDPNGKSTTGSGYYRYPDPSRDSFLYLWIKYGAADSTTSSGGSSTTTSSDAAQVAKIAMETWDGASLAKSGAYSPSLPKEADENGAYSKTYIEAVFSKEYLPSDNMGDINFDGLPDLYVKYYKFGVFDASSGELTGDDTVSLAKYNDDEDYLPGKASGVYSYFVPASTNTAAISAGTPFTAVQELRGGYQDSEYWSALNDACDSTFVNVRGVKVGRNYVDPSADPTNSTLTKLEWAAFCHWCRDNGRDATNAAVWTEWSPERPTDPTKWDSDEDNLSDGYEYYYWYRAHVGYWEGVSNHVFMTGRRLVLAHPCEPETITPAEIEAAMDPQVKGEHAENDTDNDGLSDLEESALGTNPFDFDTDGDGLPDGYEVVATGTDPLKYATNGSTCDGELNEDKDGMAARYFTESPSVHNGWCVVPVEGGYICSPQGLEVAETEPGVMNIVAPAGDQAVYTAWRYTGTNGAPDSTFCRGRRYFAPASYTKLAVTGPVTTNTVLVAHFHVYQMFPYDPRTGWNVPPYFTGHITDTIPFSARDEFLTQAFFFHAGGLLADELVPTDEKPLTTLWIEQTTSPAVHPFTITGEGAITENTAYSGADTDGDGMPDGWELYLMAGGESKPDKPTAATDAALKELCRPSSMYSPLADFAEISGTQAADPDNDASDWPHEYSAMESCAVYTNTCPTIAVLQPEWKNKWWPTNPWVADTDGDGLKDGAEGTAFVYGSNSHTANNYEDCVPGGGLNPCSWDTDCDGLPDPWEEEFKGSYEAGSSTTTVSVTPEGVTNRTTTVNGAGWKEDGMDGTTDDYQKDYDFDGLANWQEYMIGAMRCWRYDDTVSGWTNHVATAEPTAEDLYEMLVNYEGPRFNQGFRSEHFDLGVYFSCATNAFEWGSWNKKTVNRRSVLPYGHFFMFKDGLYHDLSTVFDKMGNNRYTRNVKVCESYQTLGLTSGKGIYPRKYISCDPRLADTDCDGLDDYYEIYHGLNPLLGESGLMSINGNPPRDVIFEAYYDATDVPTPWSGLHNSWLDGSSYTLTHPDRELAVKGVTESMYDFFQFPWLAGLAAADPDGDNIRNQQEAILPNVQAAATYLHTDPSPLWMTDTSYADSLTYRFYQACDPSWAAATSVAYFPWSGDSFEYDGQTHSLLIYPWLQPVYMMGAIVGYSVLYDDAFNVWAIDHDFFDYEEDEGYDSDHDFLSDFEEGQGKTKNASDPQYHDDPLRRQAMWFGGDDDKGFLETQTPIDEMVPFKAAGSEPRQNFLYFTVECWAKPDAATYNREKLQTLVERAIYTGPAGAADETYLRKNFLLGIKGRRWYAKFDSTGTDRLQPVEILDGPAVSTNWTHLAVTFDGTRLKLYVNGICRSDKATSLQPEHGVAALATTQAGEISDNQSVEWNSSMIAILVGASAAKPNGIVFDNQWQNRSTELVSDANPLGLYLRGATTIDDYDNFYRGYVDEIRVWDGARTGSSILSDYENRTRYDSALIRENRETVYAQWKQGARRSPASATQLSAEIMYHWSFDHIAGAVEVADVIAQPAGFSADRTVTDAMAKWARPEGWTNCWRTAIDDSLKSRVYTDLAWIPWVADTVGHLPRYDKTTLDSVYWSADYAGNVPAAAAGNGYGSFGFPRSAELPSRRRQMYYSVALGNAGDPYVGNTRWEIVDAIDEADSNSTLRTSYRFSHRNRQIQGFDLLPFGGAFPKRISAEEGGMWDAKSGEEPSASDAWAQTGADSNNDGLPDWWTQYALENYNMSEDPTATITWDTTVNYYGVAMPAWRAYLRDLANGMHLEGGQIVECDVSLADERDMDRDGLPDWWEELWKLDATVANADDDPDNDGLSNYQEYLISEVYPDDYGLRDYPGVTIPALSPNLDHSLHGQEVTDYFLKYSDIFVDVTNSPSHFFLNEYFGEIVTDHDFMEDWWENLYDLSYTSAKKYDPLQDADNDGWSTWDECRASLWGNSFTASLISKWTGSESSQYVICRPQPIVGVRITYAGAQQIDGKQLVVRTMSAQTLRTDATFVVSPEEDGQTKFIGGFDGDTVLHGHLSPGQINVNSVVFQRAMVSSDKAYVWNFDWYEENDQRSALKGWDGWMTHSGDFATYQTELAKWPHIELSGGDFEWESFVETVPSSDLSYGTLMIDGVTEFGWVDCTTGEYELDMSKFTGSGSVNAYVFRVTYTSRLGHDWPQEVYLSDTKELETTGIVGIGSGYVRSGRNTIEAFIDLNADGVFTEGEPFGSVRNVMVGWHKTPVATIELHDDSPIMPCVTVETESNSAKSSDATNALASTASTVSKRVRVTRRLINGLDTNEGKHLTERQLVTKDIVLDDHAYVTEADVVTVAKPDLDWSWLTKDAKKFGIENIESVTYSVDEVQALADGSTSNITLATFIKKFSTTRSVATAVSPVENAPVYASSPTFTFAASDDGATGYMLEIRVKDGATVYKSGARILPGRTSGTVGQYVYAVTPPVFADMNVFAGTTTNRALFADGSNYQWRVALVNAKFKDVEDKDYSAWADFQMDVQNKNRYPQLPTGYGRVGLAVRYYGPAEVAPSNIIVEAFENADFRGQPLAQIRLSGETSLLRSQTDIVTVNAFLWGVSPGKRFFRAYFDQNGNGIRDRWESWGYLNSVGENVKAIYNPKDYTVTADATNWKMTDQTEYRIYIEDCDVNQNEYPDCVDAEGNWLAASKADTPYWTEPESTSTVDPMTDTDGDGMPDLWENWNNGITDPLTADGDTVPENETDAMAYREETWQMVTIDDGTEDGRRYLVDNTFDARDGLVASNYVFTTYYLYGPSTAKGQIYGVGTNVVITNAWPVKSVGDVTVALVHGQVYARKGYNALTANAKALEAGTAVDTKEFTALDRYLVMRYFEAIGVTPAYPSKYKSFEEYAMNAGEDVWANWTLMPGTTDANKDFVPDGWQLYVMYGPGLKVGQQRGVNDRGQTSPWGATSATTATTPGGEGISWRQEYDNGNAPTDPWNRYTLKVEIDDAVLYRFNVKTAETQLADDDNDGLSNWAEYLAWKKTGKAFATDNAYSVEADVLDYFVRTDEGQYVGESLDADGQGLIADHDFMEDWWENLFDPSDVDTYSLYANRYVYDANKDDDEDGWKNWSECRAYLWGSGFYSDLTDTFVTGNDDSQMRCLPQPAIGLKVTYNGTLDSSWKSLIVRTRTAGATYPDAIFQVNSMRAENSGASAGTDEETKGMQNTQILGVYNGMKTLRGFLTPGQLVPSSAKFEMTPVSQEVTYHWTCTECAYSSEWAQYRVTDTNGYVVVSRSGSYGEYKADLTLHGDREKATDNRGVKLERTTVDWTTFATSGGGSDGRHGKIYLVEDDDLDAKSVVIGDIDYRTGEFSIDLEKLATEHGFDFEGMAFQAVSSYNLGAYWPQTVWLSSAKKGYVKEGLNTIEAFLDLNGDSRYDVGEPYGILQNVDIGWHRTLETRIELRDGTCNGMPLFELQSSDDAYDAEQGIDSQNEGIDDGSIKQVTIRVDKAKTTLETNDCGVAEFTVSPDGNRRGRIRIVRTAINGSEPDLKRTVAARTVDATYGRVYTVADFIQPGQIDLDSKYLVSDAIRAGISPDGIRTVDYVVYWGQDDEQPLYGFTRTFESTRIAPVLDTTWENSYCKVQTARPEFGWIGRDGYGAFAVQVSEKADFSTILYATTNLLPAASTAGYAFKPDLYVGQELKDKTTYYWRVAQLNAKFTENAWSKVASFTTAADSSNADTGYGPLAAEVRYFGPATNALSDVVVGVYETADFRSTPVARKRLSGSGRVTSLTNATGTAFATVATNVTFDGIAPGEYYVMAYVDTNGNGVRDTYETWGYACKIANEDDDTDIWTPVPATVVSAKADVPKVLVVMEDTDVNQNQMPDCLEEMGGWEAGEVGADSDGDGLSDADEAAHGTDDGVSDTDGDGMPDGYEAYAGTDPLTDDADSAATGDVMAYAEETRTFVTVWDGKDLSTLKRYVLAADAVKPAAGADASDLELYVTYEYGDIYGLGREATGVSGVVRTVEEGTLALVHAQVYDKYGFNALTANPTAFAEGTAVNTKAFTALDKYAVARYLDAMGLIPYDATKYESGEDMVNRTGAWAGWTLKAGDTDNDKDGLPDGWELYTMFGPTEPKTALRAAISPWNSADARQASPGDSELDDEAQLTVLGEYGGGRPTDPWKVDSDGDGVIDRYFHLYRLDDPTGDLDGDGLSNYAEYLISEVFKFARCDPEDAHTSDGVPDYFKKVGDLYLGEIFMDHDQVSDGWERKYATHANALVYDPLRDDDNDGWSNWSEAQAGTSPRTDYSQSLDAVLPEFPIPSIRANISYAGAKILSGTFKFMAWSEARDAKMLTSPDAVWTTSAGMTNSVKYIGKNPGKAVSYGLGTGTVKPSTFRVSFRDLRCEKVMLYNNREVSSVVSTDTTDWYACIQDVEGVLYTMVSTNSALANAQTPIAVGTIDYDTGLVTIDYAKLPDYSYQNWNYGSSVDGAEGATGQAVSFNAIKVDLGSSYVRFAWTPASINHTGNGTFYLADADDVSSPSESRGHVREGLHSFLVWADIGNDDAAGGEAGSHTDGVYDPGEPVGFVQGVDVGWQGAEFSVTLSETSAITPRFTLNNSAVSDRDQTVDTLVKTMLTDDLTPDSTVSNRIVGTSATKDRVRVRFVRLGVNNVYAYALGVGFGDAGPDPLLFEREYDLGGRNFLCEADFLQDGEFDLDWTRLRSEVCDSSGVRDGVGEVTNMTYLAVFDGGEGNEYWFRGGDDTGTVIRCASTVIERRFERTKSAPVAENVNSIDYAARPTFRWTLPDEEPGARKFGTTYTAFKLKIFDGNGTVVYDSGVRRAPAQDANGVFAWTADVSAGDLTAQGSNFTTAGNYTWQVAMYNAKFKPDDEFWEEVDKPSNAAVFSMAVNGQQEMNDHGYSSIDVAVKYAGPAAVVANYAYGTELKGKVRVQAFAFADFSGTPVSEAVVTSGLTDFGSSVANVRLSGIPATGTYYLRAYIDSNGNHVRDNWESWGAASEPVLLTDSLVKAPLAAVWIEDCDIDQDWLPDAWEYEKDGVPPDVMTGKTTIFDVTSLRYAKKNLASVSTGLDGASLTIFLNGTWAESLLNWGDKTSRITMDDIRAAVQREVNVKANTVKITAITLAQDGSVTLAVDAEVAPSIAGELLSSVYDVDPGDTKEVTINVYRKSLLTEVWSWDPIRTVTTRVGAGATEIKVQTGLTAAELKSGYFKIEIEE